MKIRFEWEKLFSTECHEVVRAKVFGGWVLNSSSFTDNKDCLTETMVFIPDPEHKWEVS